MNKRFLSALSVLGVIGTSFLGGINPVQARSDNSWAHDAPLLPGQRRETYKVSDITDADVINLCEDKAKMPLLYVGYKREGHQVKCLFVYPTGNAEGHIGVGVIIKKGNYTVGIDVSSYNNVSFTPLELAYPTDAICERKHRGWGTYSVDNGKSCEDSYRKNPWEK